MALIPVNDVFDEMKSEINKLRNDLLLANKCIRVLEKFKLYLNNYLTKCNCFANQSNDNNINNNNNNNEELAEYEKEYKEIINQIKSQKVVKTSDHLFNKSLIERHSKNDFIIHNKMREINRFGNRSEGLIAHNRSGTQSRTNKQLLLLEKHKDLLKNDKQFKCNFDNCDQTFTSLIALIDHKRVHRNNSSINSHQNESQISSQTEDSLNSHLLSNENNENRDRTIRTNRRGKCGTNKEYVCEWPGCEFRTIHSSSFRDHNDVHIGGQFTCDKCDKVFTTLRYLKDHERRIHSNSSENDKKVMCLWPNCKAVLKKANMKLHLRKHQNEGKYQCNECGFKTDFESKLITHKDKHNPEKKFSCSVKGCDKKFSYSRSLKSHMKFSHSNVKLLACEWPGCGSLFKRVYSLKIHRAVHTLEKNYSCDWPGCEFRTTNGTTLGIHKRRHNPCSEFVCDWFRCGRSFINEDNLRRHRMDKHQN
jgi:hypothetical protein